VKTAALRLISGCRRRIGPSRPIPEIEERARLISLGFAPLNAFHLALAERRRPAGFVTMGDRLFKRALDCRDQMQIEVW
jgi:hypothetical protein